MKCNILHIVVLAGRISHITVLVDRISHNTVLIHRILLMSHAGMPQSCVSAGMVGVRRMAGNAIIQRSATR